ncbi:hypothetical protein Tcan_08114 [Toxocara canis]|uniref:Uncharacterized protein n=1 Tax=Toxocara canis TaxID=6265 RepID=A0A0B2UQN4_TOXCA|nr:hypothetical protein Tcan_08114 [Toxocara canis]
MHAGNTLSRRAALFIGRVVNVRPTMGVWHAQDRIDDHKNNEAITIDENDQRLSPQLKRSHHLSSECFVFINNPITVNLMYTFCFGVP